MSPIAFRQPFRQVLLMVCLGLSFSVNFAKAQTTSTPTDLLANPQSGAKVVKALPSKTNLKVLTRKGFWLEVEAAGSKGWVKATAVQFGSGAKSLGGIETGRTGKGNIVSTSAARGLSPKELIAAKPDFTQVDQLQKFAVSSQEGDVFAGQGRLSARKLALMKAPSEGTSAPASGHSPAKARKQKKSADEDDEDE